MNLIVYDTITGSIKAKLILGDERQLVVVEPNHVVLDGIDYDSRPEDWAEIDIDSKVLRHKAGKVDPTGKNRRPKSS